MKIDTLLKLHNDLTIFSPEYPIVVQYNQQFGLKFRQLGKTVYVPYLQNYYFPKPILKLGILTQDGFRELMSNLQKLLEDGAIRDNDYGMMIQPYAIEFYKCYPHTGVLYPQLYMRLELVNIRRRWVSKMYLRRSKEESKILLNSIIHEERNQRKGSKSIKESSTSEV